MRQELISPSQRGFSWIHFEKPNESELQALSDDLGLSQLYIQDVMQAEHLPKVEPMGEVANSWFLIVRILDPDLGSKPFNSIPELSRKLAIFFEPGRLVTIIRTDSPDLNDFIRKCRFLPEGLTDFQLVAKLLKVSFRTYEPLLLKIGSDLDFFEGKLFENERFPPLAKSLYSLRRKTSVLKRLITVSEPLVAFLRENGAGDPVVTDSLDMITRIETMVEDVFERAVGLINLNLSVSSQRSNEVMRFLTLYSAFFMPLTFLVGVYGMNFSWMPELEWRWGYGLLWAVMLGIAGFHFWWFRRKNWL